MSLFGEGAPKEHTFEKANPENHGKSWKRPSAAEVEGQVKQLSESGLPDAVVASEVGVSIGMVKKIRKELGIPPLSPIESHNARKEYLREHPSPSYDITPPPIIDEEEE